MELVKPITSDHDLIELAKRIGVHLDAIFESNEITKPLPKKGSYLVLLRSPNLDVGHWQAVHDGEFFDSMGEAAPTKYGIGRYNPTQYQGTYGDYCAIMYRELTISSDVPAPKLTKALKTGKLSLTADQLKGSGSVIHLHPASYEKALKARKADRGVRLDITKHEIKKGYKKLQGGSIWSKIKSGLSTAFKFVKDSGFLSKGLDAASLTGVGVYDSDSDTPKEGGRISVADVKKAAKNAPGYAKRKGILPDAVDAGEKFLLSKATKPEHENLIQSVRGEVKRRYGVGVPKKPAKGSPEMKAKMAALRAKRKKAMIAGSFRLN
ncbi:uncharacterized protein PITG_10585 [Phytophthora infestans T30-4]|uniref:Uncharacterized protein n=1 Tax=Phytophthora infestans (strain T30-4) TaxID=403677 RepID=D0NFN5_PHYIT|nr:uncharacterized protein PITG_10585 [Phytophthora infestans T30-4]EEY57024.1 conserved hypothetical protein [Phytophthora infestans T30-4]|eukprot:XP_002902352.1 conserved hypothetical protein [Phytophthora infestans T30-4]